MNPLPAPIRPSGPAVPRRTCGQCGEWLPHACAPLITTRRQQWTGRRIITIHDRTSQAA